MLFICCVIKTTHHNTTHNKLTPTISHYSHSSSSTHHCPQTDTHTHTHTQCTSCALLIIQIVGPLHLHALCTRCQIINTHTTMQIVSHIMCMLHTGMKTWSPQTLDCIHCITLTSDSYSAIPQLRHRKCYHTSHIHTNPLICPIDFDL
jgi:phage FluMu protein Com